MPRYPDPTAEASAGGGRTVVAPLLAPGTQCGIDDLPRDVLLHVLACLDARQVVQTCVLSQLWRDLWRDVRSINASRHEFEIENDDDDYDARNLPFKKLVNRFLMLRNPVPLEEFSLCYCSRSQIRGDHEEANLWIAHALLFNARSVEVYVWADKLEIDPAVFTSEHLRILLFDGVILNPGFFRQLQSECRALERLILKDCPIDDEISSQTLKVLSIGEACLFSSEDQASISTPNLIHFGFCGPAPHLRIPLLENMESLVTAYITLYGFELNGTLVDDIRQFFLGLSCVRELDLYFGQTELDALGNNLQWCPKFNNLKKLTLGTWCLRANFYGLVVFLENSPNLEKLTLKLKEYVGT